MILVLCSFCSWKQGYKEEGRKNKHLIDSSFLTALKMAAGGGMGSGGGNPVWSFLWFLGLIFVGWPVAGFCAGWYILILPFGVCIDGLAVKKCFKIFYFRAYVNFGNLIKLQHRPFNYGNSHLMVSINRKTKC